MTMKKIISNIMLATMVAFSLSTLVMPLSYVGAQGAGTAAPKIDADELFGGTDATESDIADELGLSDTDIRVTIARIIRVAMGLLGIVAVVIILIGGFTWMTAGGNEEKVGEAKKWIFAGIIGLAIILSAFAIASFVINSLVDATTGSTTPGEGFGG